MAIPILLALVLQTISLPFLAFQLESERETVAIPMCVNKARTDIQCLGSCYINQHLEAALAQSDQQSGESTPATSSALSWSPQLLPHTTNWLLCTLPLASSPTLSPAQPQWNPGDYRASLRKPPRV